MNNSGSGSATNAGIYYQQRVSALFLIAMYSRFDISQLLNISDILNIEYISYETVATVDDLNIICEECKILYIQIKRKIALSEKDGSEFQKVLEQFLSQYINERKISDRYILVTTSDTSKSIKYDLKKIFDSIRLNDTGFKANPLNVSEKKTYSILETVFNHSYERLTSCKPSNEIFVRFCKQVFVSIIDVETDMTTEKIAVMLLHSEGINMPSLVWNYLVSQCLYYASNRLSLNRDGINNILAKFHTSKSSQAELEIQLNELLKPVTLNSSQLATGNDVFIVESFIKEFDYAIVELYRFDSEGKKILKFENDCVLLINNTIKAKVIRRFSSRTGLLRYIEENQNYYKDKKIGVFESKSIEDIEKTDAAIKYKDYCNELLSKNTNLINCIHSGKSCLSVPCYLVEVDYPNYPPAIGMVREECLLPLDRILGKPIIPKENLKFPSEINITEWISLLNRGQGLVKSLPIIRKAAEQKIFEIGWNEENQTYAEYNYTLRYNLQDGNIAYTYARGKIQRLPKYEAELKAEFINSKILELKQTDNPMCMSTENWTVGPRSLIEKMKEDKEEVVEIEFVNICKYSKLLSELYDRYDNYYAPLCFVVYSETEQVLVIGNIVPLISDPFKSNIIFENWEKAGISCCKKSLSVVRNDYQFDKHAKNIIRDGLFPVIDPKFTPEGILEEGLVIRELNDIIEEYQNARYDFRKGAI